MPDDSYRMIRTLLASNNPEEIRKGLRLVAIEITKIGSAEAKPLFEMVSAAFYIDTLDHPEFVPVVDEAVKLSATFGPWVIPILIERLDSGDIKAQWAVAHVLGRIGAPAIDPMLKTYTATKDLTLRAFILYALGKIKSPEILKAVPTAFAGAASPDLELRDTATRALGKFAESIPSGKLTSEMKQRFIDSLHRNLSDSNSSVRSKAIRSIGKLAKYGHLADSDRARLKAVCREFLGVDEKGEWDRAYIVRKEAEEALIYL